jgi:hypothetical protein
MECGTNALRGDLERGLRGSRKVRLVAPSMRPLNPAACDPAVADVSEPDYPPMFIRIPKPVAGTSTEDGDVARRQCLLASIVGFAWPLIVASISLGSRL